MAQHTYSLVISYTPGLQFAQNVLHYQFDDSSYGDTASAALALCNAFDSAFTTILRSILSVHTTLLSYKARALTAPGGFEAVKLLAGPPVGTRTGNLSCAAVSPVIVLFPTANAKPRGRVFLPGVSDTDLVDGDFSSAYRTAVTAALHMFSDVITLAGGATPAATPVVYSRKTTPGTSYAVEYARLSEMAGTQRRRQRPA
jgi:hypothetical protein